LRRYGTPVETADVIVLLARQRSGTNALRDVLDSHSEVFCLPEIFQAEPSPKARYEVEANYFNFIDTHKDEVRQILTSKQAQERFFLEYLQFLGGFSEKRHLVIDIKYNSAHNVDGPWRDMAAEPTLFELIRHNRMRVLNLTRRNYLRYYLSWVKTEMTRKYHLHASNSDAPAEVDDQGITVDLDDLFFRLELCQAEDRLIERMLGDYPRYMAIEYERLFPRMGAPPSEEVLGRVATWLGIEADFPKQQPRYRKQSVLSLSEAITNYAEVADALQGTDFEHVLDDEAPYLADGEVAETESLQARNL
jgi:hypothetical protein